MRTRTEYAKAGDLRIPFYLLFLYISHVVLGILEIILYSIYLKHSELFFALNKLILLLERESQIFKKANREFNKNKLKLDYIGLISFAITTGVIPLALMLSVVLVWNEMDPCFYLFHDLFPTDNVYYKSLARFLLIFFFTVEYFRSAYLSCLLALLFMFISLRIVQCLESMDAENSIKFYTQLRLIFAAMDVPIKKCNMTGMAGSLIFLSCVGYTIIRSGSYVSVIVSGFFFGCLWIGAIVIFTYSTCASKLCSESADLVQNWTHKMYNARFTSWNSKILWKVWSTQRKLVISYGNGLTYNPRTAVEYLYTLSTNIANLLLLFRN
ncbi:unnamed protein product [Orchesella dallaii]|uniref:Odorant receptor n=1 Tax=Orchesella dallaii TaxID=48710 RepID=A0ABP1RAR4_9HEXA